MVRRIVPVLVALASFSHQGLAQGMPAETRDNIHALLNNHSSITRSVTLTDDGYVSKTESSDTAVTRILREHVAQMQERLESGLMVRRWDPAFAEYVKHYSDIEHTMTPTESGLTMTVRGKTPEAIQVARNHAEAVTDFVTSGWEGHNRTHPAVLDSAKTARSDKACCGNCRGGGGKGAKHMGHPVDKTKD